VKIEDKKAAKEKKKKEKDSIKEAVKKPVKQQATIDSIKQLIQLRKKR